MAHSDTDLEQGGGQENTPQMNEKPEANRETNRETEQGLLDAEPVLQHERNTTLSRRTLSRITIVDPDRKYIVDWDGDHDLDNPLNWSAKKKWTNLVIISCITLITPLASSMFAPGVPKIMAEFSSTSTTLASFIVSIYVLGFAIGPMIIAPLSELYGRRLIYIGCNIAFLGCTIVCAESPNIGLFLTFRFFAGCAGVAPLTIGAGSIGDLFLAQQRGSSMAIFSMGPLLGPIIGPIAGGYITEGFGWRWVFRILAIASAVVNILSFFLDETYAPTLLKAKALKLSKIHSDSSYKSKFASNLPKATIFKRAIIRPMKLLFLSPIVSLLSLHMSMVYGYLYLLFTTFTEVFQGIYGFSTGAAGLTFLGLGAGTIAGVVIIGALSDKVYMYYVKKNEGECKPEYRLPFMVFSSLFCPIGLFWYGWSAQAHAHYIVPIIGSSFMAFGMMSVMLPVQNYLVDAYTQYAASAIAAATILRSLLGALLPLAGQPMYDKLGIGWGNSLLAFIALAFSPVPWVFWKYGERIRTKNPISLD